jgi:hypothetical protein
VNGCGGWIDRYRARPQMGRVGVQPTRGCPQRILGPQHLPIPTPLCFSWKTACVITDFDIVLCGWQEMGFKIRRQHTRGMTVGASAGSALTPVEAYGVPIQLFIFQKNQ